MTHFRQKRTSQAAASLWFLPSSFRGLALSPPVRCLLLQARTWGKERNEINNSNGIWMGRDGTKSFFFLARRGSTAGRWFVRCSKYGGALTASFTGKVLPGLIGWDGLGKELLWRRTAKNCILFEMKIFQLKILLFLSVNELFIPAVNELFHNKAEI